MVHIQYQISLLLSGNFGNSMHFYDIPVWAVLIRLAYCGQYQKSIWISLHNHIESHDVLKTRTL